MSLVNFRDLDSLVTPREGRAVSDWSTGKHTIHVMRDHPGHDMPILAGMWGAKTDTGLRRTWRKALLAMLEEPAIRSPKRMKVR